jgi:hypothetical protein
MKFIDANGNIKFGKSVFFGNNIQMSEQADGIVTINAAVLSGTGSKLSLLGDVQITSIQDDQFVRWNAGSSLWINQFITAADIGAGTFKVGQFVFPVSGNTPVVALGDATGGLTQLSGQSVSMVVNSNELMRWPGMNSIAGHIQAFRSIDIVHSGGMPASSTISRVGYSSAGGSGWQIFIDSGSAVADGSRLGFITYGGATDTNHTLINSAGIEAFASGTWSTTSAPSFMSFKVTAPNSTTRQEIARITNTGVIEQVGASTTFAKLPNVLFQDATGHSYSGTTETSLISYNLKANSINTDGQTIKIKAIIQSAGAAGAFNVKVGSFLIASGTFAASQNLILDCIFWRHSSTSIGAQWTYFSGTLGSLGPSSVTTMLGISAAQSTIDWTQDQLVDLRINNYLATGFSTTSQLFSLVYEAA